MADRKSSHSSLEASIEVYWPIVLSAAVYASTVYLTPLLIKMIRPRLTAHNYQNLEVPVGLGLVFSLTIIPAVIMLLFTGEIPLQQGTIAIITVLGFAFLGLIDDTLGSRDAQGFLGHFRTLKHGYLTTGALKAAFGMIVSVLAAAASSSGAANIMLNALNMALWANFTNLLDVRPGRAGKFFLLTAVPLAAAGSYSQVALLAFGSVLGYLPWDLGGEAMMGDVGSNVLGAIIGLELMNVSVLAKLAILVVLVGIHVYAEKGSLTSIIEQTPLLEYLDSLGRKDLRRQ